MASERIPVARLDEIPVGGVKIVQVAGKEIGIFRTPDGFSALKNVCPHRGAPLCQGEVTGTFAPSRPREYLWVRDGEILRCPWHAWEFDLHTGEALHVPGQRVAAYRVVVEGNSVMLCL